MNDATEINLRLTERVEQVCRELFPNGKVEGHNFVVGSLAGEAGKSLKVGLRGDNKGVWNDFADSEKGGDMLELWRRSPMNPSQIRADAMKQAREYLGMATPVFSSPASNKYVPAKQEGQPLRVNSPARDYLRLKRKLTDTTIDKFKLSEINDQIVFNFYEKTNPKRS